MNEQFVAVTRNHQGDIINFKTSTGRIISYQKAIMEIDHGIISGVNTITGESGDTYIRSNLDNTLYNNLSDLPDIYS